LRAEFEWMRQEVTIARSRWWMIFGLLTACFWAWGLTMPLFSGPDEPAHVVRAASIARGAVRPPEVEKQRPADWDGFDPELLRFASGVRLPEFYRSSGSIGCYIFHADIPADCAHFPSSQREVRVLTTAGRHPPTYYAVVGLLSEPFPDNAIRVYAMRLIGAAFAAALAASAFVTAARMRNRRLASAGILVALVPMAFYISGAVNPSGIEITAAVCLWAGVALISMLDADDIDDRLVHRCGIAAVALVVARPLGPVWLGLVALFAASLWGREKLWALAHRRVVQVWAAVTTLATIFAVAWLRVAGSLESSNASSRGMRGTTLDLAQASLQRTPLRVREMIGILGWLDAPVPALTILVWLGALGALGLLARRQGPQPLLTATGACFLLTIVVPVALETPGMHNANFFWQGRYTLPLAVGLPILAAFAAAVQHRPDPSRLGIKMAGGIGAALVVGQLAGMFRAQQRFMVGYGGRLGFWFHADWTPPIPALVGFVAFGVAYGALVRLVVGKDEPAASADTMSESPGIGADAPRALTADNGRGPGIAAADDPSAADGRPTRVPVHASPPR